MFAAVRSATGATRALIRPSAALTPLRAMGSTHDTSAIWNTNFVKEPEGTPKGFHLRTTFPENPDGVTILMEKWDAGSSEPVHSHPGDDMTVVVEGSMTVQFYKKEADGTLAKDGPELVLNKGDTGYIPAGRIHSAEYTKDCKLVFAHDKEFGFIEH